MYADWRHGDLRQRNAQTPFPQVARHGWPRSSGRSSAIAITPVTAGTSCATWAGPDGVPQLCCVATSSIRVRSAKRAKRCSKFSQTRNYCDSWDARVNVQDLKKFRSGLDSGFWILDSGKETLMLRQCACRIEEPQCNISDAPKIGASMERGVMLP